MPRRLPKQHPHHPLSLKRVANCGGARVVSTRLIRPATAVRSASATQIAAALSSRRRLEVARENCVQQRFQSEIGHTGSSFSVAPIQRVDSKGHDAVFATLFDPDPQCLQRPWREGPSSTTPRRARRQRGQHHPKGGCENQHHSKEGMGRRKQHHRKKGGCRR